MDLLRTGRRELLVNLTNTQRRCSELIQGLRALDASDDTQRQVVGAILAERRRQDEKWGALGEKDFKLPDGTGMEFDKEAADAARAACDASHKAGVGTWRDILEEEVAEAFAESDPDLLRKELLEVAAVALKWCETIDRRR